MAYGERCITGMTHCGQQVLSRAQRQPWPICLGNLRDQLEHVLDRHHVSCLEAERDCLPEPSTGAAGEISAYRSPGVG